MCIRDSVHVDAASSKRAEDALALLRKSLGSLPVVPLAFANEPSTILTDWIVQEKIPHWLVALEEAELRGSQEDSVIPVSYTHLIIHYVL